MPFILRGQGIDIKLEKTKQNTNSFETNQKDIKAEWDLLTNVVPDWRRLFRLFSISTAKQPPMFSFSICTKN